MYCRCRASSRQHLESVRTMAKKKTAGSDTTPTPSAGAARARRRASASRTSMRQPPAARSTSTEDIHLASADDAVDPPRGAPPSYDEIAEAAYLRYLQRGAGPGGDIEDWVAAERELRARHAR